MPPSFSAVRREPPREVAVDDFKSPSTSSPRSSRALLMPSLAVADAIDAPRGQERLSARSRRLSTLPTIPEAVLPPLVIKEALPLLGEMEASSFGTLTQQLMHLCDLLSTEQGSPLPNKWLVRSPDHRSPER